MDAVTGSGAADYQWQSAVLLGESIGRVDIGLLASTTMDVGGAMERVFLPALAYQEDATFSCGNPAIILWSDVSLGAVSATIRSVETGETVWRGQSVARRLLAQNPLTVRLPEAAPGLYRATFSAAAVNVDVEPVEFTYLVPSGRHRACRD